MNRLYKYPRTPHLNGSRLQPGDEELRVIPFESLKGRRVVVEEKLDGANSAVSFSAAALVRRAASATSRAGPAPARRRGTCCRP
ncbi:MAG TPA: RNA ligase family protein [Pyrinomonadaceae bacterium]|jgi:hypothetical protein